MELNAIIQGDCIEEMKKIGDKSIDMILADLPYGTTACKWDTIIPFEPLWEQYKRIIKDNGAIVLTASQPFTSALVMSNLKMFKYCWVWVKPRGTGHLNAKKMPMKNYEDVVVFYRKGCTYNPQMIKGKPYKNKGGKAVKINESGVTVYGKFSAGGEYNTVNDGLRYPKRVISIPVIERGSIHPTQKPVALMEYMIKTYTDEGDTVLDFTMGSGTTGVACKNLNRNFIGIEKDPEFFKIAQKRVSEIK